MLKNNIGKLRAGLNACITTQGVQTTNLTEFSLGTESLDSVNTETAQMAVTTLNSIVGETIATLATESYTPAQIEAATTIAAMAGNPALVLAQQANLVSPSTDSNDIVISAESMGLSDVIAPGELSVESFDKVSIDNAVSFSVAYNLMASRQDALGEAFFPTIAISPAHSGIAISTEYTAIFKGVTRSQGGASEASKFNKIPLAKAIYDVNAFGTDRNRVIVVKTGQSEGVLLTDQSRIDESTGTNIDTAPILIGKDVNLIGMSQTDAMVAKGMMDESDTLDRTVNLENVYISIKGDNGSGIDVTETFKHPVAVLPYSNFTHGTQDHHQDIALAFTSNGYLFNTGTTTLVNGASSVVLGELAANHSVRMKVKLNGDGNLERGNLGVYASSIEIDSIRDSSGGLLATTDATYIAIAAVFATATVTGYDVEAYRTNSNMRTRGQQISTEKFKQIYQVPLRSGITVTMPVNTQGGTDNDGALAAQIQTTGLRLSIGAVQTLLGFAQTLRTITNNGSASDVRTMGVGSHHVSAYWSSTTVNLVDSVDSQTSSDREADIRAALVNKVREEVLNAYIESGYGTSYDLLNGQSAGPVGVVIGTSPRLHRYLSSGGSTIDIGSGFDVLVVSTPNPLIGERFFITFAGHNTATKNTKPDPLSFGFCAWAPVVSTDVARTGTGAVVRELTTNPRFLHATNLPILMEVNVSGLSGVLGKVNVNQKAV